MKDARLVTNQELSSLVKVGNCTFGGEEIVLIGGPCAVESKEQMREAARDARRAGVKVLRGGVFKPRTSPYSFQGLGTDGLSYLVEAAKEQELLTVTEVLDAESLEQVAEAIDIIQIGARSMQNFQLLKLAGKLNKPVILKRGLAATIEEWLYAAEYILAEGNSRVILCERGIRTYETCTRNTLDLSSVGALKSITNLPVIVDPSHAAGRRDLVSSLAKGAISSGADGLLIEMHPNPADALCDGEQSLNPAEFLKLSQELGPVAAAVGRKHQWYMQENQSLETLRTVIDEIDDELVKLLTKRMDVVKQVAGAKRPQHLKDNAREQEIIQRLLKRTENSNCPGELLKGIYQAIFEQSIKIQLKTKRNNSGYPELNLVGE
ncbi:MAG TPA: bifunctional 3-deoxy-7-phosphoheptulonate synthase/chorismate mutase [Candidatus Deferrimicrobium sp.]|nr:bifunctional 3-deoxy-7-phosphoheptulonate synthase/chorismate mutase [Candidatus Deferrimicrobium sp.]